MRDAIVTKALAAPVDKVGSSFQTLAAKPADQVQAFNDNLAAFLVQVYGGPKNYSGKSMEDAHAGLNITSDQYDYFVLQIVGTRLACGHSSTDERDSRGWIALNAECSIPRTRSNASAAVI